MISIRWRLTFLLGLAIGSLFVATGAGVYLAMKDILRSRFDETLTAKARALITASEIDGGDFEIDLTVQDFAGFGSNGDDYFQIRRMDGSLFLRSPSLKGMPGKGFEKVRGPVGDEGVIRDGVLDGGKPARYYVQRIYPKDDKKDRFQDLYLIVASPTRGMQAQLGLLATVLGVAGGAALLLMVPVIRIGLGRGLRPLHGLAREIGAIRPDDLDRRLNVTKVPAELVPVATGLNGWLARLDESFERERRFTSHAAHELRTPLAELKTMAELGSMAPEEATTERFAEIADVADELAALLEKLALLARADAGRQSVVREPVDLPASVESSLTRLAPLVAERSIRVVPQVADGMVFTDPLLWNTILQNLLANAARHAPVGAEVRVRASPGELVVSNPAPDLTGDDLDRLFERFWRKDEARSGYGHSGLSLSIVKACVSLLGGECGTELSSDGILQVRVRWPDQAGSKRGLPGVALAKEGGAESAEGR